MRQLTPDPWTNEIPKKLKKGIILDGKVTKNTNFGVIIDVLEGLEGLLHVSEMEGAGNSLAVGQAVKVKVLNVDFEQHKIGLSRKGVPQT